MPKANRVHPSLSRPTTKSHSTSSTVPNPAGSNLQHPAMEGLYVYTAKRLEAIRLGGQAPRGGYKPVDPAELRSVALWRAVGAEFLAQVIFVFVGGCSVVFFKQDSKDDNAHTVQIALAFGLCIMALIQMIGHVSGGHINPAVTVAMAVTMNISVVRAALYVVAQCVGAIFGGLILKGVVTNNITKNGTETNLAVTSLTPGMTEVQGFGIEVILTFVLVFVIFGTTDENRPSFGSPALLIGLTVTLLHLAGIRATGASMNPSRSLGSAIASNHPAKRYEELWVYWLGPIIGGILAALTYKFLISPYRNCLSMDDAIQKLLQDENFVAIPRDYFKVSTGKNAKDIKESSNL